MPFHEQEAEAIVKRGNTLRKPERRAGEPPPPSPEAAAFAALAASESLILALAESGAVDPAVLSRCLHDAAEVYSTESPDPKQQRIRAETAGLIDNLLRQLYAVSPHCPPRRHGTDRQTRSDTSGC